MTWRSSLYVGTVMHHRFGDPEHRFTYPLYLHLLDLDELPALDAGMRLFGWNRRRPVAFHDADHLDAPGMPTVEGLRRLVESRGAAWPGGRVLLLTQCRVLGHVFNPVSFFYCYGTDGRLGLVVAEVNNTFGERHCYLLDPARATVPAHHADGGQGARAPHGVEWAEKKVFHVSPFYTLDGTYRFVIEPPHEQSRTRIDLSVGGRMLFTATMRLDRRPLSDATLARLLVRYPLVSIQVVGAIHWHALRLWWKGARYWPKPPYDPEAARGGVA